MDVLLTGCEVSLWLLEQFAADLAQVPARAAHERECAQKTKSNKCFISTYGPGCKPNWWCISYPACDKLGVKKPSSISFFIAQVFPRFIIKTVSANKLLGLYGQDFPIPATGHQLDEVCSDSVATINVQSTESSRRDDYSFFNIQMAVVNIFQFFFT